MLLGVLNLDSSANFELTLGICVRAQFRGRIATDSHGVLDKADIESFWIAQSVESNIPSHNLISSFTGKCSDSLYNTYKFASILIATQFSKKDHRYFSFFAVGLRLTFGNNEPILSKWIQWVNAALSNTSLHLLYYSNMHKISVNGALYGLLAKERSNSWGTSFLNFQSLCWNGTRWTFFRDGRGRWVSSSVNIQITIQYVFQQYNLHCLSSFLI